MTRIITPLGMMLKEGLRLLPSQGSRTMGRTGAAWLAACRGAGISKNSTTLSVSADGRVFVPSNFCEYITIFLLVINTLFFFFFFEFLIEF